MKFAENKVFPHPVLSEYSDDYVDRGFQAAFRFGIDEGEPTLQVKCSLSDEALSDLVKAKQASFAVEVVCAQTFLRRIKKSQELNFGLKFNRGDLHGRVDLNAFVVCLHNLSAFRSPNFNLEYGESAAFDLDPGSVLAIQHPVSYWWDVHHIRPLGTVFDLEESSEPKPGSFLVSWEEEKIQIRMRHDDLNRFQAARGQREKRPILLMSVYFPTLIETLRVMAESPDEYENKKWFRAIQYRLDEQDLILSGDKALSVAQALLRMPLNGIIPNAEN